MPGKGSRCLEIPTTCCGNALFFSGKLGSAFQIPFRGKSNKLEFLHAGPAYAQLGNTYAGIYPKSPKILEYPPIFYHPTSGPTYSNSYLTLSFFPYLPIFFAENPVISAIFSEIKHSYQFYFENSENYNYLYNWGNYSNYITFFQILPLSPPHMLPSNVTSSPGRSHTSSAAPRQNGLFLRLILGIFFYHPVKRWTGNF